MNEAPPQADRHRAERDYFEVAFTIARMPALIASDRLGHAATTAARSRSVLQLSFGKGSASASLDRRKFLLDSSFPKKLHYK